MSRSKNLKRARALFQKKALKQERQEIALQQVDHQVFYNGDLKIITIDRALTGSNYKVSSLVIEMIQPLIDTANEPEDMRGMLLFGVVAWNKGIQREAADDPEFSNFQVSEKLKDNPWISLLDDYVELKCTKYKEYKEYITDSKFSCTKDKVRFTVKTVQL